MSDAGGLGCRVNRVDRFPDPGNAAGFQMGFKFFGNIGHVELQNIATRGVVLADLT